MQNQAGPNRNLRTAPRARLVEIHLPRLLFESIYSSNLEVMSICEIVLRNCMQNQAGPNRNLRFTGWSSQVE